MISKIVLLVLFTSVVPMVLNAQATGMRLTEDGQALATIVLPENPKPYETTAARELAGYLKKVTGANFTIQPEGTLESNQACILVGNTHVAQQNQLVPEGGEAWCIRTVETNQLVLTGGEPNGTLYAVWHFLEDVVGVHWWNYFEEDIPHTPTLTISALNLTGEPAFKFRIVHDTISFNKETAGLNVLRNGMQKSGGYLWRRGTSDDWKAYGRIYPVDEELKGHGLVALLGWPYVWRSLSDASKKLFDEKVFSKHPDWFAFADGKRQPDSNPCMSNPELLDYMEQELEKRIVKKLQTDPESSFIFDVSILDDPIYKVCRCGNCLAAGKKYGGNYTGVYIHAINTLATRMNEKYPQVRLQTYLAYDGTGACPRDIKTGPGVIPMLVMRAWDMTTPFCDPANNAYRNGTLQGWLSVVSGGEFTFYRYDEYDCMPHNHPLFAAQEMRYLRDRGCIGGLFEDCVVIGESFDFPMHWVRQKLFQDPDQDVDQLLEQFCCGYYGDSAGQLIKDVWDLLLQAMEENKGHVIIGSYTPHLEKPYLDLAFLSKTAALFDQAEIITQNDPEKNFRVRYARLPYDYALLKRWPLLMRQQEQAGKDINAMPFQCARRDIAQRMVDTFNTAEDKYLNNDSVSLTESAKVNILYQDRNVTDEFLVEHEPATAPFPAELKDVDRINITEVPAECLMLNKPWSVVADKTSAIGVAACLNVSELASEERAQYDFTHKNLRLCDPHPKTFEPSQLADRYTLYKIEDVHKHLSNPDWADGRIVFFGGFGCSTSIYEGVPLGQKNIPPMDVYVSLRFQGNIIPGGHEEDPSAIYIDRVFFVRK